MLMNNRWIQMTAAISLLLCSLDFVNRYEVGGEDRQGRTLDTVESEQVFSPFADERVNKILAQFEKFDVPIEEKVANKPATKPKPNPRLSKEFQNKQKGNLSKLFIGDYSYRPLGVFDADAKFALLEQRHLKNRKTKRIKVIEGQKISDYQVTSIELNSINIAAGKRKITLRLFDIKQKANNK
ncbi:hypothetical protein [Shewanella waksmanii]|uniref:hypothetical protein n=1 Tax=Shewanella waksmanii TaxID=213783 RepID=UPI00048EE8D2|nr:hypothetical protein [Shewanella waksmanii]